MTLTSVPGFQVGHAQVQGGGSGCTVILGPFRGAVEIRGLATGSRETPVLSPEHLVEGVDALLLSGGSAFGLAAADGVMEWLEEEGRGFDTGSARVPLVPGAVIFDLEEGRNRPGPREGRMACVSASANPVEEGRVGAGAGATVGKVLGPAGAVPGGLGSASRTYKGHRVGGLAVVNALGDVMDAHGGILAGAMTSSGEALGTDRYLQQGGGPGSFDEATWRGPQPGTNTTLAVVGTDLPLSRIDLARVARMAVGAFARAISPVGTPFDGDILFALSSGSEPESFPPGDLMGLGVVAREVVEEAIRRGVVSSSGNAEVVG